MVSAVGSLHAALTGFSTGSSADRAALLGDHLRGANSAKGETT
jgi:hypothetical protein